MGADRMHWELVGEGASDVHAQLAAERAKVADLEKQLEVLRAATDTQFFGAIRLYTDELGALRQMRRRVEKLASAMRASYKSEQPWLRELDEILGEVSE